MSAKAASHRVIQIVTVLPALAAALAAGFATVRAHAADLPQSYKAAPSYTTPQPAFSWDRILTRPQCRRWHHHRQCL